MKNNLHPSYFCFVFGIFKQGETTDKLSLKIPINIDVLSLDSIWVAWAQIIDQLQLKLLLLAILLFHLFLVKLRFQLVIFGFKLNLSWFLIWV